MLRVATSRINHIADSDDMVLNTTIGSGTGLGAVFAPTWDLVRPKKPITWEQYTEGYYRLLRNRYMDNQEAFNEVLSSDKTVVFCCYCNDVYENHHCHRYLLVEIFRQLAESRGIEFEYVGEFGKK